MLNHTTRVYTNPDSFGEELLMIVCITKTMLGWNCNNIAHICRERCGGMGFLANCRFGEYIACAHAQMTAEGDNRVLMGKITKDYLTFAA